MGQLRSNEVVGRLELGGSGLLIEGRIWGSRVGCLVDTGSYSEYLVPRMVADPRAGGSVETSNYSNFFSGTGVLWSFTGKWKC